jgi:hypothetical protein
MGGVIVERGELKGSAKNPPSGTNGSLRRYVAGEPATHKEGEKQELALVGQRTPATTWPLRQTRLAVDLAVPTKRPRSG